MNMKIISRFPNISILERNLNNLKLFDGSK